MAPVSERQFAHRLRIRYHEVDPQGIVFNSRYLEYLDVAMTEWFRWLGWPYPELVEAGLDPSLVSLKIDWAHPARFDEELLIGVSVDRVGSSSYTLVFEVCRASDGEQLAHASVVYVNFDAATQRASPVPEQIRQRLLAAAPAGADSCADSHAATCGRWCTAWPSRLVNPPDLLPPREEAGLLSDS
jgi:acyl-CoA thioester hydrolase